MSNNGEVNYQPQKLELHFYDGKINCDQYIIDEIARIYPITREEYILAFSKLREVFNQHHAVLICIDVITNDYLNFGKLKNKEINILDPVNFQVLSKRMENNNNYDPSNNLFACELLYLCYENVCKLENKDFEAAMIEQLSDMVSGLCNPGRTTRLYQLLITHALI